MRKDNVSKTAYESILEYSSLKQFADFRMVLIGNRGTIASGNLATGMSLIYDKNAPKHEEQLLFDIEAEKKVPIGICQRVGGRSYPGLIFDKNGYDEILKQVEAKGEISLRALFGMLRFAKDSDEKNWEDLSDSVKRRCISRNLDKLIKDTNTQYHIYGDRMHYLAVGVVKIEDYKGNILRYPLFLFSCADLDISKLRAMIDVSGFINFWLDKNVLNGEIGKKTRDNFEIALDADFTNAVNTIALQIRNTNLSDRYKLVEVDPSFMSFQIISGFEAEYVDPAWEKMLEERVDCGD
jgi:hypothetical protein